MALPEQAGLKLATYNTHRGIGFDRRRSAARIVGVLEELQADVVALQEVEKRDHWEIDALSHFADSHGYQLLQGPTMFEPGGHYGNAVLTRLPVTRTRLADISYRRREPRGALIVDLQWKAAPMRIVATHLGLLPRERRYQLRQLLPYLEAEDFEAIALMGDFNEWFLWGRPLRWLHKLFPDMPLRRSFPAPCPIFALDCIWLRPARCLQRQDAYRSPLAKRASDHLPVVAEITC